VSDLKLSAKGAFKNARSWVVAPYVHPHRSKCVAFWLLLEYSQDLTAIILETI